MKRYEAIARYRVKSMMLIANMRAIVERMLPIIDNRKLPEATRKRAEKAMIEAAEIAARTEKE